MLGAWSPPTAPYKMGVAVHASSLGKEPKVVLGSLVDHNKSRLKGNIKHLKDSSSILYLSRVVGL